MSDEEKAKEIANNNCTHACCSHGEHFFTSESDCYKAAMEMAAWKNEQIKNKIEQFFSEHDDWDYQVSYMDDYTDMDRLKIDLLNFIGL